MFRQSKGSRDKTIGTFFAFILGWALVTVLLCGVYEGGRKLASYVGWSEEPLVFGLLITVGFVWISTRFDIDERHDRLRDRIEQLEQTLWENGLRPKAE